MNWDKYEDSCGVVLPPVGNHNTNPFAEARAEERERIMDALARDFADQPCLLDDVLETVRGTEQ